MRIGRPLTLSSGTCRVLKSVPVRPISSVVPCRRIRDVVVFSANPDTEEARSPLDAPQVGLLMLLDPFPPPLSGLNIGSFGMFTLAP
jgi:hypothetical protein